VNHVTLTLVGWVVMAAVMAVLWVLQRARRDAGVVDVGWAAGLGLLAVLYAVLGSGAPLRRLLVAGMAGVWSVRLAWYILVNRVIGKPEDGRYRTLRSRWGVRAQSRFFVFFQFQALVDVIFSIPYLVAMTNPRSSLGAWDVAGVLVWVVAVGGEALADRQLAIFRADPANHGRTCRVGLWRASRHPNYFFEWLHWWAYVLLAGSPWWALTSWAGADAVLPLQGHRIPATEGRRWPRAATTTDYARPALRPLVPETTGNRAKGNQVRRRGQPTGCEPLAGGGTKARGTRGGRRPSGRAPARGGSRAGA
jgi:steroid 5-alpha reductase family enzyme